MLTSRHEIDVRAQPEEAFDFISRLDLIPKWMPQIEGVRRVDGAIVWDSSIAGVSRAWISRITRYHPGALLDWEGFVDPSAKARITFWASTPRTTTIGATLGWQPQPGAIGDPACMAAWRLDRGLERLKVLIEGSRLVRAA
jgi:hypothetical protein